MADDLPDAPWAMGADSNPPIAGFAIDRQAEGNRLRTAARMRAAWPNRPLTDAELGIAPSRRAGLGDAGVGHQAPPFDPSKPYEPVWPGKRVGDLPAAPWAKSPSGGGAPPFDPSKPYQTVWPGTPTGNVFDPADYARYKDTLPDAPWAKSSAGMFDDLIPRGAAKAAARQWAKEAIAPPPARPQSYSETLAAFDEEARQQLRRGVSTIGESTDPSKRTLTSPFQTLGGVGDIAGGLYHAAIAPATAAFRNYVSTPLERLSYEHMPVGVRAEDIEKAAGTVLGGAGARTPAGSPLRVPRPPPSPEALAARTAPERGSALSIPGTLARQGPVDLAELERAITPAAPSAEAAAEVPTAVERPNLGVRLLQPEVPHDLAPRGRASVGAAGAEADPLADYSPQTVQRARELLTDSGLDNPRRLEQALEEASPHHTFAELTPALEKEVSGIHAADKGVAKNLISQTYLERAREAPQRMAAVFDRVFGEPQNRAELTRAIEAERAKTASPLWRQFTATTVTPTPALRALLPRLDASGALRAANKAMREEGLPVQQGFSRVPDAAGEWAEQVEHMPTAAAFQYAKEHLDALIERSLAEPGGAKAARRYTQLKNDLLAAIDNHPDPNVAGVWQAARQTWQRPTELLEAQKLGKRVLTNNVDREDVPFLTAGWSPERMDHLDIGIRGYLEDLEKANRSPARTSNRLLDAVLAPGNQDKLRAILGDARADTLIDAIRHEESMHGAPTRIVGGSPTAERQAARDRYTAEGQGAVGKSLSKIAGYVRHPVRSMAAEGVEAAAKRISTKQEAAAAQLRDELARIMTTQGPERNAIARALVGAEEPAPSTWARPTPPPRPIDQRVKNAIIDHFRQQGVPVPDDRLIQRVVQMVRRHDLTPGEAHELAAVERSYAGSNGELSPASAARNVSTQSGGTSPSGAQAPSVAQQQPGSAEPRRSPRLSGEVYPGQTQPGYGPHPAQVRQDLAVREATRLGLLPRIQQLAMHGKSDAEIAMAIGGQLSSDDIGLLRRRLGIGFAKGGRVNRQGDDRRVQGELPEARKASHEEVGYVAESPRAKQRCGLCTKFIIAADGRRGCKRVQSPVAASGWCRRFVRDDTVPSTK